MAGAYGVNVTQIAVATTAVSWRRSVLVEVSTGGYVIGVCLLGEAARQWHSQTIEDRVKSVAQDRYLSALSTNDGSYPTTESVAAAELKLDF